MNLIDVVKCESNEDEVVWKFPSEDLSIGTRLIVMPNQYAVFVKNGQFSDVFKSGRYTLSSNNIPLLNKVINLPFGNRSPFEAEVWFVNKIHKLDNIWGTTSPFPLTDPFYKITITVRARGQYGITISDPSFKKK